MRFRNLGSKIILDSKLFFCKQFRFENKTTFALAQKFRLNEKFIVSKIISCKQLLISTRKKIIEVIKILFEVATLGQ